MIKHINIPDSPHKHKQFCVILDQAIVVNNSHPEIPNELITIIHDNKCVKAGIHKDSVKQGNQNLYWDGILPTIPQSPEIIDQEVFLLYDDTSGNYAHFWFDFFGQLCYYDLLKQSNPNLKLGLREEDYTEDKKFDYIKQVINLCYPDETPIIFSSKKDSQIKKLIIPNGFYWFPENQGHEPILNKVKHLIDTIPTLPLTTQGCYISRQDTIKYGWHHKRDLVNELELIDKIKLELKYDIIELMDYDIIGKIQIFKSYPIILQQNGAANVNAIFSNENSTHIILSYPKQSDWMNFKLGQFCEYTGANLLVLDKIGYELSQDERDDNNPWVIENLEGVIEICKQVEDNTIWT
jgi:hypothetical protein